MKVSAVRQSVNFGRMMTKDELNEYETVLVKGKKLAGQTGHSIFIMPTQSLPQSPDLNTGIGHLTDETGQEFIKYMHSILGFNVREDLPAGQIEPYNNNLYINYRSTSLALGDQNINPKLLTTDEYANLLTKEDVDEIVKANKRKDNDRFANFHNIMNENGGQNQALKKAYERFENLENSHPLKAKYQNYIKENSEWIDFMYKDKGEFFKFKQFLADSHHKKGVDFLHSLGVKSCGDCLIGATTYEAKARPYAFSTDWNLGWQLPTPDIEKITDTSSDAYKYMKYKVQNIARRNDMIRFDVGWAYIQPRLFNNADNSKIRKPYLGDKVLKQIEKWVKEVKGEDFDLKNLIWETEAGPDDFQWEKDGKLIEPLQKRVKIYGSMYMSDDWGSNDAFIKRGFDGDYFVIGVGNHDHQPLREIANDISYPKKIGESIAYEHNKQNAIKPLARILKLDEKQLQIPIEFAKAKFAEPMMAKNMMEFFMDDFAYQARFDKHEFNCNETPDENYAHKILYEFKKQYHDAVESGYGVNKMDSLEKIFKAKGLDRKHPQLYKLIVKYRDILYEKTSDAVEDIKSTPKNKPMLKILAAGAVIIAAGGYFYIKSTKNNPDKQPDEKVRASLIKTA